MSRVWRTHPPEGHLIPREAGEGCLAARAARDGPRERPAVENCGLRLRNRQARFGAAPGRGLGKRSPQRPVAGRFVRFPPTGAGRGRGVWVPTRPAVENCGLHLRNRLRQLIAAPARGLGKRSPQRPVAGRSVRFPPTGDGRGRGRWVPTRPAVENCGLRWRNRQARLGPSPHSPCPLPSPKFGRGERGNTPPLIRAPVPWGEG